MRLSHSSVRSTRRGARPNRRQNRARLVFEPLEQRLLLAQVSWNVDADGFWDLASNWVDDQGVSRVPGASDDVILDRPNGDFTITFRQGTSTVASITARERLEVGQLGGTTVLTVTGAVDATAGLTVAFASLAGATLSAGTTVRSNHGTLRGVTVNGTIDLSDPSGTGSHLNVANGLTLNGTLLLDSPYSSVSLRGAQTLDGTGTIHFGNVTGSTPSLATDFSGPLTIGPNLTILAGNGTISGGSPIINHASILISGTGARFTLGGIENRGRIRAEDGATVSFVPGSGTTAWTNHGVIESENATLTLNAPFRNLDRLDAHNSNVTLQGPFRLADLGNFIRDGGALEMRGTLDNRNTTLRLDATTGPWRLSGTILGGALAIASPEFLSVGNGTYLDAVTVEGTVDMTQDGTLIVRNGLTLNGTLLVGSASNARTITFDGTQTLSGTGRIVLANSVSPNGIWQSGPGSSTLTISPSITIQGGSVSFGAGAPLSTIFNNTIQASDGLVLLRGPTSFNGQGGIVTAPQVTLQVTHDLLGDTRNPASFMPLGLTRFRASGVQQLEVMSQDRGATPDGLAGNFAFGAIELYNGNQVRLVDRSDNATGTTPEVLYAESITVERNATLDMNGLKVYTRGLQIDATASVINGTIVQIPDSGPIEPGVATAGRVGLVGERDEWTFFGRRGQAVTVLVNPGTAASPAPVAPTLQWAEVRLLDSAGVVVASARNTQAGQAITLNDVVLANDGTYRIEVHAAPAQDSSTGNYLVTFWDSTADDARLPLNERVSGRVESPPSVDHWRFAASAGQSVQFDLTGAAPGLRFRLSGPGNTTVFTDLAADSGQITLLAEGEYVLTAYGDSGATGDYAFVMHSLSATDLTLGTPYDGTLAGGGQYQLFRVRLSTASPLLIHLDDSAAGNRNELYVRLGAPPTRSDSQYQSGTPSADQRVVIPRAAPGDWYVLLYTESATTLSDFQLTATTAPVVLGSVTPDRVGAAAETVLTVTGAGFTAGTMVELVAANNQTFAGAVTVHAPERLTARLAAGSVPPGVYAVRATRPGATARLDDAVTVIAGGQSQLETHLVLPSGVAFHYGYSEIFVEYANRGDVAMPAPVLVLHADSRAVMTLDRSLLVPGGFQPYARLPEGFSDTVQVLASGATPGLLQPGESFRVPVYFAGLQHPQGASIVNFALTVSTQDQTDPVDWAALRDSLRPPHIAPEAWAPIYANFVSQVGSTWGDYVGVLNDNAAYLGRLGQRVTNAAELFAFELQQATGLHPVRTMDGSVDAAVETPGLGLSYSRFATNSILGRYELGGFGRGWHAPWEERLVIEPSDFDPVAGSVYVTGPAGMRRRFPYFFHGNSATYHSESGDLGRLTRNADNSFDLREADGMLRHFRADGRIDYLQDLNGNRVTAQYTGNQLTRLTHSSGQFLSIAYTAAGRIGGITDSEGETTQYTYDAANEHLLAVRYNDGRTERYSYSANAGAAREHALTSVQGPDGVTRSFEYDSAGRLTGTFLTGNAERVDFLFDSAGAVTVRDAVGSGTIYFDSRGLVVQSEDALARVARFTFDDQSRLTRVIDAAGLSVEYGYDSRGNVIRVSDQLGRDTQFAYEEFVVNVGTDRLTAVTDANGNTTRFSYDARSNPTATTYPNQTAEQISYDALGNVQSFTNRRGRPITFAYNAAGQITRKTYADGAHQDFAYDARGNLLTATDSGGTTTFAYDTGDRLTRVSYPGGRFLAYTYDAAGRRTGMVDQDGFTVNYAYDAAGRLERLTDAAGGLVVGYTYDAAGRMERKDLGGGNFSTYEYDAAGQLLHLVNRGPDNSIHSRFDYTYDVLGRRTGMSTLDGTWAYEYDATGQLVRAVFTSTNPAITNQDLRYEYDAVGNRVRTVINGVTTDHVTNSLNQYVEVGDARYHYDADGNLTSITTATDTFTFSYDDESRLVGATGPDGVSSYEYDSLGNRDAATRNGQRTEYLIDPSRLGDVVGEYTQGQSTRYVHALGLVSMFDAVGPCNYEFDALGNVVGMMAPNGLVHNRYAYAPFGERILIEEAMTNPFQFVGKYGVMSEANGLEFMRARFYSPAAGRFTTQDPIRLAGGDLNLYRYVANSPTNFLDPIGLLGAEPSIWDAVGGAIAAIGAGSHIGTVPVSVIIGAGTVGELALAGGAVVGAGLAGYGVGSLLDAGLDALSGATGLPLTPDRAICRLTDCDGPDQTPSEPGDYPPSSGEPHYAGAGGFGPGGLGGLGGLFPGAVPTPPSDPNQPGDAGASGTATSYDPNAKTGPAGFGAAHFVRSEGLLPYRIDFENDAAATAPARRVDVTDPLDARLDWDTFEFTEFGFGDILVAVPPGSRHFRTTVPMHFNDRDFLVEVELDFDSASGKITASFRSFDPNSFMPLDVLTGFLPPEDGTGRGQGHFSYVIRPDVGLASGTAIRNVADIRFDYQAIITTNQVDPHDPSLGTDPDKEALVTIDAGVPTSTVLALPAFSPTEFPVTWSGSDEAGGSGISSYDVFVSENGGSFVLWRDDATETSESFSGVPGYTYAFYSVATDNVGHRQETPSAAQSTTTTLVDVVQGTAGNDDIHVVRAGDQLRIYVNVPPTGGPTYRVPIDQVATLTILAGDGDDVLTVDSGGAAMLGLDRLIYNAGAGINALVLANGSARIESTAPGGALNTTVRPSAQLTTSRLHQNALSLDGNSRVTLLPDGETSRITSLSLDTGATLDIGNNALVLNYTGDSPLAEIREKILSGRGGPGFGASWNGTGMTSSAAAQANSTDPESRSVGVAENGGLPLGAYTSFRGQPVDDTSLLIAFARTGDANLDGVVNDEDVTIVGATYAPDVPQPQWSLGDFDYNGFVDDGDATLLGVFYDPSSEPLAPPDSRDTGYSNKSVDGAGGTPPQGHSARDLLFGRLGGDPIGGAGPDWFELLSSENESAWRTLACGDATIATALYRRGLDERRHAPTDRH